MIWPPIPYSFDTINYGVATAPSPPDRDHWLGTDDQTRDVVARVIYGFRISVLFALVVAGISSLIGVVAGACQGYFGGWVDLFFQRVVEIWANMPSLYIIIILSAIFTMNFWLLTLLIAFFSWTSLVGVVRAEFLRARNFEYVRAARALGVGNVTIMFRHMLPNAMVATLTLMPFIITGAIGGLAALDFLGLGLPPSYPSLGELALQGKNRLNAPWLGFTAFFTFAHHAVAARLHLRGRARRLRPAKDLPVKDAPAKDSRVRMPRAGIARRSATSRSPSSRAAQRTEAVRGVSFELAAGETLAIVGESGSGKSVTALSTVRLLPDNADITGSVRYRGREMITADERTLRGVRGNDISFIFQEPMTSLNPLHTIEKQLGESLALHQGLTGAPARARILELLTQVGIRDPEEPARRLPAPALRRPAPAGDDRDGAGERPRRADRRRADHRARRDDPGADPDAARRHPARRGHGDAVHHPQPRHRAPHRRPGRGDAGRRDRRDRPDRGDLRRAAAPLHPQAARRRADRAAPTRSPAGAPTVVETDAPARLVPDQARPAAPHRRPRQGGERRDASRSAPARRSASSARAARARPRSRSPSCG